LQEVKVAPEWVLVRRLVATRQSTQDETNQAAGQHDGELGGYAVRRDHGPMSLHLANAIAKLAPAAV